MTEIERTQDQLKLSLEGEAWHGPAVMELLDGVTAAQAATKPIAEAHSIWEIAAHLAVWVEETLARIEDRGRDRLKPEEDWPPVPSAVDQTAWEAIQTRLRAAHDAWYAALGNLPEADLHRPQKEMYPSVYVILHGLAQHNLYHAGQIAILKKLV